MRRRRKDVKRVSRQPQDLAFKQQRLTAWQPIITPHNFLPWLFVAGLILLPVGVGLLVSHSGLTALTIDYTHCMSTAMPNTSCYSIVGPDVELEEPCVCHVPFTLEEDIADQVYIYYKLDGFVQNHRRYVRSRDDHQLRGFNVRPGRDTSPMRERDGRNVAPAGAIANSMFNDTISLLRAGNPVALTVEGITWPSDINYKFRGGYEDVFASSTHPPNWHHPVWAFPDDGTPGLVQGFRNPDFINWMRVGTLKTFRKLYRKVTGGGLDQGQYTLNIVYRYPVWRFGGRKKVVLATTNLLGGRNFFMGTCYVAMGGMVLLVGSVLLVLNTFHGRQVGDSHYLVWRT